jgi:hypothetical protein
MNKEMQGCSDSKLGEIALNKFAANGKRNVGRLGASSTKLLGSDYTFSARQLPSGIPGCGTTL